MAVTRPQTQPGVVERWALDLADAVAYANDAPRRTGEVRRHLRRRSWRAERRGRRVHQSRDGRHDGPADVDPFRVSDEPDLAIAIDLGTGGPKDRPGHARRRGPRPRGAPRRRPTTGPTARRPRTLSSGGASSRRRPSACSPHTGKAARVRAVAVTGQYASTVPVDANGRSDGTVPHVARHARAAATRAVRLAVRSRATGRERRWPSCERPAARRPHPGADPIGHMLYLVHDEPETRRSDAWFMEPVDYLTMRFTGVGVSDARLALALVADGQPRPRSLRVRRAAAQPWALDAKLPAAASPDRLGRRAP